VLGKTLGVPLFQEQAMQIAIVAAGFTPARPTAAPRHGHLPKHGGHRFPTAFARACARTATSGFRRALLSPDRGLRRIRFPESHAASFALLVYASAWLKRHHPASSAARC
jgi:error-prone DNA polymerase